MFRNSRPTPSPQTIELIRQLAYISGGALCGVTALYLEDCRRRIQILQRVLDNRRVIVQVAQARRYSKVALAAKFDEGNTDEIHLVGPRLQSYEEKDEPNQVRSLPRTQHDRPPSEPSGFRTTPSYAPFRTAQNYEEIAHTQPALNRNIRHVAWKVRQVFNEPYESGMSPLSQPSAKSSNGRQNSVAEETFTPRNSIWEKSPHIMGTSAEQSHQEHESLYLPPVATRDQEATSPGQIYNDRVGHDVSHTTATVQPVQEPTISEQIAGLSRLHRLSGESISINAAQALWPHVLREGSLSDLETLCDWMWDRRCFSIACVKDSVEAIPKLKDAFGPKPVFQFYTKLLDSAACKSLEAKEVLRWKIRLLAHAVTWDLRFPAFRVLGQKVLRGKTLRLLFPEVIIEAFEFECRIMLSTLNTSHTVSLWLAAPLGVLAKRDLGIFTALLPLSIEILQAAIENNDLQSCKRILQRIRKHGSPEDFSEQINIFVEACERQENYEILADFIVLGKGRWTVRSLLNISSDSNKAIIAVAIRRCPQLATAFEDVYRQVPKDLQHFVHEHASIEALRAMWTATRNIDSIEEEAQRLSIWLKDCGDDEALLKLDGALLEIYLNAGKYDKALDCIARIHQVGHGDVQFLALATLYFAKNWMWDGLTRLLDLSKKHGPFTFDERSTRVFNDAIRFYMQAHSSIETWTFISCAMDELGFTPNFATVQLMLRKTIRDKSIDLLPRWLYFMSKVGSDLAWSGTHAPEMLREYFLWTRQPGDVMFRLCQRLTASIPYLRIAHFSSTLKMAIGQDLRFAKGSIDETAIKQEAFMKLDKVKARGKSRLIAPVQRSNVRFVAAQSSDWLPFDPQPKTQLSAEQYHETIALMNDENALIREETASVVDEGLDISGENDQSTSLHLQEEAETFEADSGVDVTEQEDYIPGGVAESVPPRKSSHSLGQRERTAESRYIRKLEGDMALRLSLGQYKETLNLYRGSCDAAGLPASVRALRHAIDASIRLHQGDTTHAEQLIADAKRLGMDTHRAIEPLLIHQSSTLAVGEKRDARRLGNATIKFYVENCKNGYQVKYALAHTVANVMITKGHAQEALGLLATIFQSDYTARKIPIIDTMSIWVKAYAQLLSIDGVGWVIRRVLHENLTIDQVFLRDLEKLSRHPFSESEQMQIRDWLNMCETRRVEQDLEAKIFGSQLVDCLVGYANKYSPARQPYWPKIGADPNLLERIVSASVTEPEARITSGSERSPLPPQVIPTDEADYHYHPNFGAGGTLPRDLSVGDTT